MKEVLEKVFNEFLIEKEKPVKGNELYSYLFNDKCAISFYDSKVIDKNQYEIHSSGGKGNWGIIPWIGVFDKDISTTARKGYYIVYLFSADMTRVYLSLNQGWTLFKETYGAKKGKLIIAKVAEMWKYTLQAGLTEFSFDKIDLGYRGNSTDLPKGYELGHICGKCYYAANLPEEDVLVKDLQNLLSVFRELKGKMVDGSIEKTNNHLISEFETGSLQEIKRKKSEQTKFIDKIIATAGQNTELTVKDDMPDVFVQVEKRKKAGEKGKPPVDYVIKAERQEKLGLAGELMVIEHEKKKLKELNINKEVEHVSKLTNDTAGYDVKSYDESGSEINIEVKTTKGDINTPFYLTANELEYCKNNMTKYRLYRVYNFDVKENTGDMYVIEGDLEAVLHMEPQTYIVKGRKEQN